MDRPEGFQPKSSPRSHKSPRRSRGASQKVKAATKQRASAEKAEYRRFTQATRRRRITWAVSLGSVGVLLVSVVVLTLSIGLCILSIAYGLYGEIAKRKIR